MPDGADPLSMFAQEGERDTESCATDAIPGGTRTEPPPPASAPHPTNPLLPQIEKPSEDNPGLSVPAPPTDHGFDTLANRVESQKAHNRVVEWRSRFVARVRTYLAPPRLPLPDEAAVKQLEQTAVSCEEVSKRIEAVMREARQLEALVSSLEVRIRPFIEGEQAPGKAIVSRLGQCAQEPATLDSLTTTFASLDDLPDAIPVLATIRRFATGEAEAMVPAEKVIQPDRAPVETDRQQETPAFSGSLQWPRPSVTGGN